ncbi:uncharacterized protein MKZ38_004022 [Zalerion maritima]|uniref:Uncharacterized protein n=1 Tax=Zalerion maritima TaxID=339359 RepID=A0AAD5RN85_9PEZI|nr:uncharacterized protein MKZ38_004022 [Zalerion maritima]
MIGAQDVEANKKQYQILREAYRGLPPAAPYGVKPDVIVVRLQNIQQLPGQPPQSNERDILWIECKAPSLDVPHEWNRVLNEAVGRLDVAHPTRRVYLILAIGLKWMPFLWDPVAPTLNPQGSPLNILKDNCQIRHCVFDTPLLRINCASAY